MTNIATRRTRIRWARVVQHWTAQDHWRFVLYSFETRIRLKSCDGRMSVWREKNKRYSSEHVHCQAPNRQQSLMFWGCVGPYGQLVEVPGRMNSRVYVDLLEENLRQSVENIYGDVNYPSCCNRTMHHLTEQELQHSGLKTRGSR